MDRTRLTSVFVEVADTLVDDFDIIDFLDTLCARTAEVTDWETIGLVLSAARGELQHVASSSRQAEELELFQLKHNEGPCIDARRTGSMVACEDLRTANARWPLFAPHAVQAGILAVHAFPLRLRNDTIGAMNAFAPTPITLAETDAVVVQALADVATIGIIQERALSRAEALAGQLQYALESRIVIEQAKGVVSRAFRVTPDEAFDIIRSYTRRRGLKLADVARDCLTDPLFLRTPGT